MGNADKMIFYAKEMFADLAKKPKHLINPYLIAKLDLTTVKYFDFPKIPIAKNKYTIRSKTNIAGSDYLIHSEKIAIAGIAKLKAPKSEVNEML